MGTFALDVSRFAKKAGGRMDLVVRKVVFDLFSRVIMRTPVDKGRARGNWQAAIGSIPRGETGRDDQGPVTPDGSGSSSAKDEAMAVALEAEAGDVIYLVNNLPYIPPLEYGSEDGKPGSQQAPQGMVRITVQEYPGIVQRAAKETRK